MTEDRQHASNRAWTIAAVVLLWCGLVACRISNTLACVTAGLTGLVGVVVLAAFLFSTIKAFRSRKWHDSRNFGGVLLFLISAELLGGSISARQLEASEAAALPIIAAAERFHVDTGTYPRSIDDLVPAYLSALPRTKMGFRRTAFSVHSTDDRFYVEFVDDAVWMLCRYDSQSKRWRLRD